MHLFFLDAWKVCERPHAKVFLALGGPSLSLYTHMSYGLYFLQSLLLASWLILAALSTRYRVIACVAFATIWLIIGWRMQGLF